ncbi:scaffolding protein [Microbacterium phage RikSengupta]|nr:scaffolding protein [Microbacterium phage TinyMiny]WMI33113.1 scaffolding protein [Microbacterium phage RikSengupta]
MMECSVGATPKLLLKAPIWALALHGRDGEDDAKSDKPKSDDGAKPEDDDEDEEDDKDDKSESKGDKKPAETVETLSRKLANAEEARNRAVDKRNELIDEVKELKVKIAKMEKDGSPDETIKQENETLKETNAKLDSQNQQLRLEIALRDDNAHQWVNPAQVLRLVDLSDVDFDSKTNQPRGLKAALDKLAKESPNLLKPKDDEDGADKPEPRSTGKKPAPKKSGTDSQAAAEAARLKAKYPALRR